MITTKILNENDIKNLVTKYFEKQGLIVSSFEINLTSRSMDRFGHSDEHVFRDVTVTVEEKQDPARQSRAKKNEL